MESMDLIKNRIISLAEKKMILQKNSLIQLYYRTERYFLVLLRRTKKNIISNILKELKK